MRRLGILLSGRGSNFEAIAASIAERRLDGEIAVVVANRPEARGLERARELGFHAECVPSKGVDRHDYDALVIDVLKQNGVELVCLAGFMRLLTGYFIREFP